MAATDPFNTIIQHLSADDPIVRADAARLLGDSGSTRVTSALIKYLQHEHHYTKVAGVYALWQIKDPQAIDIFRSLLTDPKVPDDWYWYGHRAVRVSAAIGLAVLGDESGLPYLHELADQNHDLIFSWYAPTILRLAGDVNQPAKALNSIQARITVGQLVDQSNLSRRWTEPARLSRVAETLGLLADQGASEQLIGLCKHPSRYVRGQAALGLLERMKSASHRQVVKRMQDDSTDFVRTAASEALCKAFADESSDGVARISRIANDSADPFDQAAAVETLGRIGDASAIPVLLQALSHHFAYVRQCAVEALETIAASGEGKIAGKIETMQADDPDVRVRLSANKCLLMWKEGARDGG